MTDMKEGWRGRYFEDFAVGDVYRCRYGRTLTEAHNIQLMLLTNNINPIRFDGECAKRADAMTVW